MKCLATNVESLADFRNHCLAVLALVMVSWVVKVLMAITNRVVSAFSFFKTSAAWVHQPPRALKSERKHNNIYRIYIEGGVIQMCSAS